MRLLVDSNILIYAVNKSCPEHRAARDAIHALLTGSSPWCLTWGVIYEYFRVSTHPRVFPDPLTADQAMDFISALLKSDRVVMLAPTDRHEEVLRLTLGEIPRPAGNIFHDIETAVILREHGVHEILTSDSDFLRFRFLKVTDPVARR
ncbi:MAG: TA system VapC family ribonuclease toxin [bacterium]